MKISPAGGDFYILYLRKAKYRAMRHRLNPAIFFIIIVLITLFFTKPYPVYAEGLPPHLIQTVTEQDIYEGILALGYLKTPALEKEDCGQAYENVKNCVVRIQMGNAHGSGIVWDILPDSIIVVTNRHVLDYWKDESAYVHFPQGFDVDAQILGRSERFDVGFVTVDCRQLAFEKLQEVRCARADNEEYEKLQSGDLMFLVDPGSVGEEARFYEGSVGDPNRYIEDFDAYMLYGYCFARAGMSGGGTFDGQGYLIGMTTGGTQQNETASVPLPDIIAAYEEVCRVTVGD